MPLFRIQIERRLEETFYIVAKDKKAAEKDGEILADEVFTYLNPSAYADDDVWVEAELGIDAAIQEDEDGIHAPVWVGGETGKWMELRDVKDNDKEILGEPKKEEIPGQESLLNQGQ